MKSPLSPIIADLVMQDLTEILNIFDFNIPFFYRYLVMAIPFSKIDEELIKFNSFYPRIQFTMEISGRKINFFRYNDYC